VAAKFAHEPKEAHGLDRMHGERQVRSCERTILGSPQRVAPPDPASPLNELVDVAVVTPHVVRAQVDRSVCRPVDPTADILGNDEEGPLGCVERTGARKAADAASDDHRLNTRIHASNDRPYRGEACLS
jgi:hypothetical protein